MFPQFQKTLCVLALALFAGFGFSGGAFAADPPYTVSNIHVDASAASSTEAFNTALDQGRPKAWQILFRRLTRQQDWQRQPELDTAALLRITRGYVPANERRSTTRYVADVTYSFNPDAVARLLQGAGIPYSQGSARRILVIPMSPGFQLGPWASALNAPALRDSVVPFTVAGESDAASLKEINFDAASWNDIAAAAQRANASEAALVQLVTVNGKVTVTIRRLGSGETPVKVAVDVPQQAQGAAYSAAASAAIGTIEDMWKARSAIDYSKGGKITVNVSMASLQQWGAIQSALAGANDITNVTVNAMDIGYAQISITYTGSAEQLRDLLGGQGLVLAPVRGQAAWTLAMNGTP